MAFRDIFGSTSAHVAAKHGHAAVLRFLHEAPNSGEEGTGEANSGIRCFFFFEAGVNLTVWDDEGMTPAHYAAENGHVEALEALAEARASS